MTITIPNRRDKPQEPGRYVVIVRSTRTPIVATWSDRDHRWCYQGRRVDVDGWEGPIEDGWRNVE